MKPFIIYVSLLLLSSGLILSFYWGGNSKKRVTSSAIVKQADTKQLDPTEIEGPQYFNFQQIIEFAAPALKK